eukprot:5764380-Prymnesium_polylepis.1
MASAVARRRRGHGRTGCGYGPTGHVYEAAASVVPSCSPFVFTDVPPNYGMFFKAPPPPPPPDVPYLEQAAFPDTLPDLSVQEFSVFVIFMTFLVGMRVYGHAQKMQEKAVLNMAALNRVNVFKECFLGYVNAGMLEPIMALAGEDDITPRALIVNVSQLIGLFSWLYLLSDAFDITDTQQNFIYWDRLCAQ